MTGRGYLVLAALLAILLLAGGSIYLLSGERPETLACTEEARMCPDGTGVGRTGPACSFAPCPPPNVEFPAERVAFALPAGYALGTQEPGADGYVPGQLAFYEKASAGSVPHFISVYRFEIPEGKTPEDTIVAETRFYPSDEPATGIGQFTKKTVLGRTVYATVIERFEGQVVSSYYLPREDDILRFDVMERDVTDWTDPGLIVEDLPEHQNLLALLATLQL